MSRSRMLATLSLGGLLLIAAAAAQASTITCESTRNSYQSCPVDTSGGVRLSRQLSSQGCWQNDTWGFDRHRIWVDRGCRAEFQVGGQSSSSSGKTDALAAAAVVGIAAAAIIASNHHDDHHNKNNKNKQQLLRQQLLRQLRRSLLQQQSLRIQRLRRGSAPDLQLRIQEKPEELLQYSRARTCGGLQAAQLQPVHLWSLLGRERRSRVGRGRLQGRVRRVLSRAARDSR